MIVRKHAEKLGKTLEHSLPLVKTGNLLRFAQKKGRGSHSPALRMVFYWFASQSPYLSFLSARNAVGWMPHFFSSSISSPD